MNSRLPFLLLGLSALGACASVPPPPPGPPTPTAADNHRIGVSETSQRMEIPVSPHDVALSQSARAELREFAGEYLRYGHGALVLSAPTGGPNAEAAGVVAHETRLALAEAGVSYAAVSASHYGGEGDAPIVLSFSRFEAHAPECAPLWQQDLAHQSNNQPWESFGCASQANLAAMIEDPRDLLRPRTEEPRDGERRATVMEAYREGERTHSERSNDERIQVTDAVD